MPRKRKMDVEQESTDFGSRLAELRHAAGYSQRELAAQIGVSHRMVAYYEKAAENLPTQLLPRLAEVLGVTSDQLLGIERVKANGAVRDSRLWRRFKQIERLPAAQRKPIIQVLDAFLAKAGAE